MLNWSTLMVRRVAQKAVHTVLYDLHAASNIGVSVLGGSHSARVLKKLR